MAKYLINEESLVGIADKTRALTSRSDDLTIAEIIEVIDLEKTYLDATLAALADKGVEVPEGTTNAGLADLIVGINTSGKSGSLNFEIIGGTTEPTNPSENMIWINTDAEITCWIFDLTQPTSPTEGMVWIHTGTDDLGVFNAATDGNALYVYPISAQHYISGEWVEKTVKAYRNGEWKAWLEDLWLIKLGSLQQSLARAYADSEKGFLYRGTNSTTGVYEFMVDEAGYHYIAFGPIDLTNYSTLIVTGSGEYGYISVSELCQHGQHGSVASVGIYSDSTVTNSLDISSLVGNHYIMCNTTYIKPLRIANLYLTP